MSPSRCRSQRLHVEEWSAADLFLSCPCLLECACTNGMACCASFACVFCTAQLEPSVVTAAIPATIGLPECRLPPLSSAAFWIAKRLPAVKLPAMQPRSSELQTHACNPGTAAVLQDFALMAQALVGKDAVLGEAGQQTAFLARLSPQDCQRLVCQVCAGVTVTGPLIIMMHSRCQLRGCSPKRLVQCPAGGAQSWPCPGPALPTCSAHSSLLAGVLDCLPLLLSAMPM